MVIERKFENDYIYFIVDKNDNILFLSFHMPIKINKEKTVKEKIEMCGWYDRKQALESIGKDLKITDKVVSVPVEYIKEYIKEKTKED